MEDGQIVAGEGKLISKASLGGIQVHAEWMAPTDFKGPWYGSGNNGVTLMDQFEIQIFDSASNKVFEAVRPRLNALTQYCPNR